MRCARRLASRRAARRKAPLLVFGAGAADPSQANVILSEASLRAKSKDPHLVASSAWVADPSQAQDDNNSNGTRDLGDAVLNSAGLLWRGDRAHAVVARHAGVEPVLAIGRDEVLAEVGWQRRYGEVSLSGVAAGADLAVLGVEQRRVLGRAGDLRQAHQPDSQWDQPQDRDRHAPPRFGEPWYGLLQGRAHKQQVANQDGARHDQRA